MLKQMEMDPVIQIVTRDRNRLAIQPTCWARPLSAS